MWKTALLLFFSLLILSCSSNKGFIKAKKATLSEVLELMEVNKRQYVWFSAKAKVKVDGPEGSIGGRANIRMIKDSLIWMNFKKMSIEGSRALMTRDTFFIVYRLDDMYETGTLDELLDAYKINLRFDELQDYVAGNIYIPKAEEVKSFEVKDRFRLDFIHESNKMTYWLDGLGRLLKLSIDDDFNRSLTLTCQSFNDQGYAETREFLVKDESGQLSKIKFDFSQIEFDEPKNIAFAVPAHYRKLP
jgi:hypothetical protein